MTNGNSPISIVFDADGTIVHKGLTKREYFAAMAIQGLLARQTKGSISEYADLAVCQADALISELNKQQP